MKIFHYITLAAVAAIFWLMPLTSRAESQQVKLYLFWQEGCPHCLAEKAWLKELQTKEPYASSLAVLQYDVADDASLTLLKELSKKMKFAANAVPITIVGNRYFLGFDNEAGMGATLQGVIDGNLAAGNFFDPAEDLPLPAIEPPPVNQPSLSVPFWGRINPQALSLPALAAVIGLLDGFNPCAMWSLLFLISLLLGMQDRKKMWLLGTAFIVGSAAVYFVFMAAWLNLILFLGFVLVIRVIIGLAAVSAGVWNLRKFWQNRNGGCEVVGTSKRRVVFEKIKQLVYKKSLWLSLIGILALSFAVNLVELLCSAGFPAIFTQILALNNLAAWQYYSYILLYLLFFMLDDLVVFIIAMVTLKSVGLSTKYSRWSSLIGGILMLVIGLLLIFKYQWLMF